MNEEKGNADTSALNTVKNDTTSNLIEAEVVEVPAIKAAPKKKVAAAKKVAAPKIATAKKTTAAKPKTATASKTK
jgi:phage head maturation protease